MEKIKQHTLFVGYKYHCRSWVQLYCYEDSKELKKVLQKDSCSLMCLVALFTKAKTWTSLSCPSTDEWINKMCCTYTIKYYLFFKRKEFLTYYMTWINIGDNVKWNTFLMRDKYHTIIFTMKYHMKMSNRK